MNVLKQARFGSQSFHLFKISRFLNRRYINLLIQRAEDESSTTFHDQQLKISPGKERPRSIDPDINVIKWRNIKNAKPFSKFLTDNFNRQHDYLRISITERCNLRCQYCMPEEGIDLSPPSHILSKDEILYIAKLFVSQGVTKIRLTGGEPTVRKDLLEIMAGLNELRQLGLKDICITTNAISLHRKLPALKEYGLTAVNISLDTLIDGKYTLITRRNGLNAVLRSIDTAISIGIKNVKINVVVMRNFNEDEILNFVEMTKDKPLEIRFIEYMPFDGNKWTDRKMFTFNEMMDIIKAKHPHIYNMPHKHGDTSKTYRIPEHMGKIGFITSMTSHFCSTCTRLRITSDGNLKVCLFGANEVSLRDLIRANCKEDDLLHIIGVAVKGKKEKHAGIGELEKMKNRPMILIGG